MTVDIFDSQDFAPEKQSFPWLQVLHSDDPERAGIFITTENAAEAELTIPESWRSHTVRFKSGDKAQGFLFDSSRMLVLRSTPLRMFRRSDAVTPDAGTFIGSFDALVYRTEKKSIDLKTKRLVFLLGNRNELLHQSPIQFTTSNSFGASFSQHLTAFQKELQTCYGKKRGDKFLMNGVFAFRTDVILKGEKPNTAWVSSVVTHEIPTKDTWRDYFVGYHKPTLDFLVQYYEATADFAKLSKEVEPDVNLEVLPDDFSSENMSPADVF